MARYSRRTGPPAHQEATGAYAPINGLTLTREFGNGPYLLILQFGFFAGNPGGTSYKCRILMDGVTVTADDRFYTTPNGYQLPATMIAIVTPAPGTHTLVPEVLGSPGAGDQILANSGQLIVIELPNWETQPSLT